MMSTSWMAVGLTVSTSATSGSTAPRSQAFWSRLWPSASCMKGLGCNSRETGNSLEPAPPHRIVGINFKGVYLQPSSTENVELLLFVNEISAVSSCNCAQRIRVYQRFTREPFYPSQPGFFAMGLKAEGTMLNLRTQTPEHLPSIRPLGP